MGIKPALRPSHGHIDPLNAVRCRHGHGDSARKPLIPGCEVRHIFPAPKISWFALTVLTMKLVVCNLKLVLPPKLKFKILLFPKQNKLHTTQNSGFKPIVLLGEQNTFVVKTKQLA